MSDQLPDGCLKQDFEEKTDDTQFNKQMGVCYGELKKKHDSEVEAKYKEQYEEENKKLKEDSYSGTSIATGSIGAGTAGLACGLGLFPCLVKLVSKFR